MGSSSPRQAGSLVTSKGALSYQAFGFDQTQSRVHGNAAVITGRNLARGAYQGNPVPEAVRATLTLVADAGRWKLAAIHMSFIAGTPGAPPIPGAASPGGAAAQS